MRIVLVLLLVACAAEPPPVAPAPEPGLVITEPAPTEMYRVLDRGGPDRRLLRVTFRGKAESRFSIVLETMQYSRWQPRVIVQGIETFELGNDGLIHDRSVIDRIVVMAGRSDDPTTSLQAKYNKLVGMRYDETFDTRTIARGETRVVVPDRTADRDSIDRVKWHLGNAGWLPEDSVGVGARFQKTTTMNSEDRTMARTITWEVTSLDGDTIGFRATSSDAGGAQERQGDFEVLSYSSTGTVESTINYALLTSKAHTTNRGTYQVRYQGEQIEIEGAVETDVEVTR